MWESVILTLAATAGNNIGKVFQKKGTLILPPLSFKLKELVLEDGICYIKAGFCTFGAGFSTMFLPVSVAISMCCSVTGFFYQTRGFKHGRAIVVSTCAAVASIVTGVLAGMFALGERLPSAPGARLLLLFGWLLIIVGVVMLVSSSRLVRLLLGSRKRPVRACVFRAGSTRLRDPNPSAVIHTNTLHNLLSSPSKEKP